MKLFAAAHVSILRAAKTRKVDCDSETVVCCGSLHYCTGLPASEVCRNEIDSVFTVSVGGSVQIAPRCAERFGVESILLPHCPKQTQQVRSVHLMPVDKFELPQERKQGGDKAVSPALVVSIPNNSIHLSQMALLLTDVTCRREQVRVLCE